MECFQYSLKYNLIKHCPICLMNNPHDCTYPQRQVWVNCLEEHRVTSCWASSHSWNMKQWTLEHNVCRAGDSVQVLVSLLNLLVSVTVANWSLFSWCFTHTSVVRPFSKHWLRVERQVGFVCRTKAHPAPRGHGVQLVVCTLRARAC